MEWIFFAVGVAVIGVIGIALGLVLGRAVARRAARGEGGEDTSMTPVGPPAELPDPTAESETAAGSGGDGGADR